MQNKNQSLYTTLYSWPQAAEKGLFSESILSRPRFHSHSAILGEIPSTILPPSCVRLIDGPCSSTPDMQYVGTGMGPDQQQNTTVKEHGMESGCNGGLECGSDSMESERVYPESEQSGTESGQCETEELEVLKQLVDQLEKEKENLLEGNKEICQELNEIDASKMVRATTLHKIVRENSLLRMELAAAHKTGSERERERDAAQREVQLLLKAKAVLAGEVASLRLAVSQSSPADVSMSNNLQQEVARLTEENLVGQVTVL